MLPETGAVPPPLPRTDFVAPARPWGPWATLGWALVIVFAAFAAQTAVVAAFAVIATVRGEKVDVESLASDGNVLAPAACAMGLVAFGLSLLFAGIRDGMRLKEYLALRLPSK